MIRADVIMRRVLLSKARPMARFITPARSHGHEDDYAEYGHSQHHHFLDRDWMPGPYPKNEEERRAAAKKYNMLPEEYEPFSTKFDMNFGDYPRLPNRTYDNQNPYDNYEYMANRHHYGEPIHVYWELFNGFIVNYESEEMTDFPMKYIILTFGTAFFFIAMMHDLLHNRFRLLMDRKPLHVPKKGEVHYHYPSSDLDYY